MNISKNNRTSALLSLLFVVTIWGSAAPLREWAYRRFHLSSLRFSESGLLLFCCCFFICIAGKQNAAGILSIALQKDHLDGINRHHFLLYIFQSFAGAYQRFYRRIDPGFYTRRYHLTGRIVFKERWRHRIYLALSCPYWV